MTLLPSVSALASETDRLIGSLLIASLAVLALVLGLMAIYIVRYHHDSGVDRGEVSQKTGHVDAA